MQAEDDKSDTYYYCELVRQIFCKMKDLRSGFFFFYDALFLKTYFRILCAAHAVTVVIICSILFYWALYINIVVIKQLKSFFTNIFQHLWSKLVQDLLKVVI